LSESLVTLKLIREDFEMIREAIEEHTSKISGEEAEALRRVLEAFNNAESEDSKLKIEMKLEDAKILSRELKKVEQELVKTHA